MDISVHFAHTSAEREAIYRLRYEIYIEEMHIFIGQADHNRRMLYGSDDKNARLLYAMKDGEIIGSLRLHLGKDAPFSDELEHTYQLPQFREAIHDEQMLILTRFMVKKPYRGTSLAHQMICEVARTCVKEDIEVSLCDCQPHLIRYYQRIGFRGYQCEVYNDPEFGIMIPLAFINGDLRYLERIHSPLKNIFAEREADPETTKASVKALGTPSIRNISQLYDVELSGLLKQLSANSTLFDGIDEQEISSVIKDGHIIDLSNGDRLIRKGQPSQTMFVLLEGMLELRDDLNILGVVSPGNIVGELSFLLSSRRPTDVYVTSSRAVLLSLDDNKFRKKLKSRSAHNAKLLMNLSISLAKKLANSLSNTYKEPSFTIQLT